jgi:hypothetical protein
VNGRIIGEMKLTRYSRLLVGCLIAWTTLATAAAKDKLVLDIEVGARFAVPACNLQESKLPRLCFDGAAIKRLVTGADEYRLIIPKKETPPYVRGEIRVAVLKSIVESVSIATWGIQSQELALAAFTKKYGAPTRARREKQKGLRSRTPSQFAEWDLAEISVKLDGTLRSIDWGRVEVITHRYRRMIKDAEKHAPGNPTKNMR